jgi:hypothetical protein
VAIGVAAVLMVLGLFAFPWIKVRNGSGTTGETYPRIAEAISTHGSGGLNWWQHLYLQWFAVVIAVAMLAVVAVTVAVVARRPPPPPLWTWAVCVLAFGMEFANFAGLPDFPAGSGASGAVAGVGSVALGYLILALACPTAGTRRSPTVPAARR